MADTLATAATPDFVNVQLTEKAVEFSKNGPLRFSNGRREFVFVPNTPQKVDIRFEWRKLLEPRVLQDGSPMFEIVPIVQAASTAASMAAAKS